MSTKKMVKGLAMGAILAGVAALAMKMREDKNKEKARALSNQAQKASDRVVKHALSLGKLTKSAYLKLIDTVVDEYKDLKEMSAEELAEMRSELRDSWDDVNRVMKGAPSVSTKTGKSDQPCKPSKKGKPSKK